MTEELDPRRLRALLDATAKLPKSIEPPADSWGSISERINARGPSAGYASTAASIAPKQARPNKVPVWRFAAAAVLMVAISSGVTATWLRSGGPNAATVVATSPEKPSVTVPSERLGAPATIPANAPPRVHSEGATPTRGIRAASVVATPNVGTSDAARAFAAFDVYQRATAELEQSVHDRRSQLDPRSAAVLDTCLRKIDEAIAEARDALGRNPQSAFVNRALSASYQQKIEVLKRAAEGPRRSL